MKKSIKLQIRASELRSELNGLAPDDAEKRSGLLAELDTVEAEYRAALRDEAESPDPEGREARAIESRASLGRALERAAAGRLLDGAEAELRASVDAPETGTQGGTVLPWPLIAPRRTEDRADASTSLPSSDRPVQSEEWTGRIFDTGTVAFLGIPVMAPRGPGERTHPVITAGASGGQKAAGAKQDAEAATIAFRKTTPRRLSGTYIFRVEDAGIASGYEDALRGDLSMAISRLLDNQAVNSASGPAGLIASLTDPTDPASVAAFSDIAGLAENEIDGLYAMGGGDVRIAMTPAAMRFMSAKYPTNDDSKSALGELRTRSGGLRACEVFPAASSNVETLIAAKTGASGPNACVDLFGGGVEVIRDPYTGAQSGEVRITHVTLYDFAVLRSAGFSRLEMKTA